MARRFDLGLNDDWQRPECPVCGKRLSGEDNFRYIRGPGCIIERTFTCSCGAVCTWTEHMGIIDRRTNDYSDIEWVSKDGHWAILGATPIDFTLGDLGFEHPVAAVECLWPEDDSVFYGFMDADGTYAWPVESELYEMPNDFIREAVRRMDSIRRSELGSQ